MKWDILCLTMPSRTEFLARLRQNIEPQLRTGVRFVVKVHDPELSLGSNRQRMREESDAHYVSFVDDDDLVAGDYVSQILPRLTRDYVGFSLQAYEDGVPLPGPTYHSLMCGGWFDKTFADGTKAWFRDISHLNPIKRKLALAVPMYGGFAEDSRWAGELRALGIVKTENFINEVMYHYYSRPGKKDGVSPGPVTAGTCPHCQSFSTVMIGKAKIFCNRCSYEGPLSGPLPLAGQ
jgi:hypothetical protein